MQRGFFERFQTFFGLLVGSLLISAALLVAGQPIHTVEAAGARCTSICASGQHLYVLGEDGKVYAGDTSIAPLHWYEQAPVH
jgi:hypothetical protein